MKNIFCNSFSSGLRLALFFLSAVVVPAIAGEPETMTPERGVLILSGGGPPPEEVWGEFTKQVSNSKLTRESGFRISIIPTADEKFHLDESSHLIQLWRTRSVNEISLIHAHTREVAESRELIERIRKSSGVWINGGTQSILSERYAGTAVERELVQLLNRGGVVGGTSAGTAIMTKVMIERSLKENPDEPVPGVGFNLLPGFVADQHFLARKRTPRLEKMLLRNPKLYGLGVDERTAAVLFIEGNKVSAYSVGKSEAMFYEPFERANSLKAIPLPKGYEPVLLATLE